MERPDGQQALAELGQQAMKVTPQHQPGLPRRGWPGYAPPRTAFRVVVALCCAIVVIVARPPASHCKRFGLGVTGTVRGR